MARENCLHCFRVTSLCYCSHIQHFEIEPLIVLLVHPREFKKTIGTVRMVKLSLTNSLMIRGSGPDLDQDERFLELLADQTLYPMVLFPGNDSLNLNTASNEVLTSSIPAGRRLAILVIDGTWSTAKQMINQSKILKTIPKISFNVMSPSTYQFRRQPEDFCLSTVEAVNVLIENLKLRGLCEPKPENAHHQMLQSFKFLVESQVKYDVHS